MVSVLPLVRRWLITVSIASVGVFFIEPLLAGEIVFKVEEPRAGSVMTGVSNIRGWAVSSSGMDRIELYIDGEYKTDIPMGGSRKDVGAAYPGYPDSDNAGFSMANNYNLREAGSHILTVKLYDNDGAMQQADVQYNVTRFEDPFIDNPNDINIQKLSGLVIGGARSLTLKGADVQGEKQDIQLEWQNPRQNFSITGISPSVDSGKALLEGTYTLSRLTFWYGQVPDLPPGLILDTDPESTSFGGIEFRFRASGSMTIDGKLEQGTIRISLTAVDLGIDESDEEQWTDTIVADEGWAVVYPDLSGGTYRTVLLQRGSRLIWMEHYYDDPDFGDAVLVSQWQKIAEATGQAATSRQPGDSLPSATASAKHSALTRSSLQAVRKLLQRADQP